MEAVESSIPPLTPAQSETLDLIRLPVEERITHSSDLRAQTLLEAPTFAPKHYLT